MTRLDEEHVGAVITEAAGLLALCSLETAFFLYCRVSCTLVHVHTMWGVLACIAIQQHIKRASLAARCRQMEACCPRRRGPAWLADKIAWSAF